MASIPLLIQETGVNVLKWSMSEAQAGKSACDRMAAKVKNKLRAYVINNNDVLDASQFLAGLKFGNGIEGFSIYVSRIDDERVTIREYPKNLIESITSYSEFVFESIELRVYKYADIGIGRTFSYDTLKTYGISPNLEILEDWRHIRNPNNQQWHVNPTLELEKMRLEQSLEPQYWSTYRKRQTTIPTPFSRRTERTDENLAKAFPCPEETCLLSFDNEDALNEHLEAGKHKRHPLKITLRDHALSTYEAGLEGLKPAVLNRELTGPIDRQLLEITNELPKEGFAIFKRKASRRFSIEAKNFVKDFFQKGKESNRKINPQRVSQDMKRALKPDGTLKFSQDELLDENQIKSLFSRFAAETRQNADNRPMKSRKRKVLENLPDSLLTQDDDIYHYNDEPAMENEFSSLIDAVINESDQDSHACVASTSRTRRKKHFLHYYTNEL